MHGVDIPLLPGVDDEIAGSPVKIDGLADGIEAVGNHLLMVLNRKIEGNGNRDLVDYLEQLELQVLPQKWLRLCYLSSTKQALGRAAQPVSVLCLTDNGANRGHALKLLVMPVLRVAQLVKVLCKQSIVTKYDKLQAVRILRLLERQADRFHEKPLMTGVEAGCHIIEHDKARRPCVLECRAQED